MPDVPVPLIYIYPRMVDTHIQREQDGTVQSLRDCFLLQPTEAVHVKGTLLA